MKFERELERKLKTSRETLRETLKVFFIQIEIRLPVLNLLLSANFYNHIYIDLSYTTASILHMYQPTLM